MKYKIYLFMRNYNIIKLNEIYIIFKYYNKPYYFHNLTRTERMLNG